MNSKQFIAALILAIFACVVVAVQIQYRSKEYQVFQEALTDVVPHLYLDTYPLGKYVKKLNRIQDSIMVYLSSFNSTLKDDFNNREINESFWYINSKAKSMKFQASKNCVKVSGVSLDGEWGSCSMANSFDETDVLAIIYVKVGKDDRSGIKFGLQNRSYGKTAKNFTIELINDGEKSKWHPWVFEPGCSSTDHREAKISKPLRDIKIEEDRYYQLKVTYDAESGRTQAFVNNHYIGEESLDWNLKNGMYAFFCVGNHTGQKSNIEVYFDNFQLYLRDYLKSWVKIKIQIQPFNPIADGKSQVSVRAKVTDMEGNPVKKTKIKFAHQAIVSSKGIIYGANEERPRGAGYFNLLPSGRFAGDFVNVDNAFTDEHGTAEVQYKVPEWRKYMKKKPIKLTACYCHDECGCGSGSFRDSEYIYFKKP